MTNLPQKYDHKIIEKKWQNFWREKQIFRWEKDLPREKTFVIDTPPPTVSGLLHMGHIFSYTQADFVARFQRMNGKTVFYPMGFDDNGLPTERLVEKVKNIRGVDMERQAFVKECQSVVDEAEKEFEELFNSIALSVDWNEKYQTISPKSQKISQLSFLDLFKKGLVERKFEPVLWDIVDRTALSQADLVDKEKDGMMNYVKFAIADSLEMVEIMTTRPELLPACVALMINPNDAKYQHLFKSINFGTEGFTGSYAVTPIFGIKVPVIADEMVQMDKGTGAVMCCTFGDETDIKWWKKHNIENLRVVIGKSGRIDLEKLEKIIQESAANQISDQNKTKKAFEEYHGHENGRSLKEAKDWVVERLKTENLLTNQEAIKHSVKCAERSGCPIEILVTPQWFIKIVDFKEQLKAKAKECNWYPDYMRIRIEQWIDGASWDWCISRQRFFGVPFPIWYSKRANEEGKILVADLDQLPCDPLTSLPKGYEAHEVIAETDVMDTWATSSVTPQLSSHGINSQLLADNDLARHNKLFPADLRPQAHEIIRSWAFYTIVKALHHQNSIPWKNLMISGWCLAADKTKMSKSKGNVITPNSLIEEKGSDIVRYWASTSNLGADTAYSEDVLKIGNKLLNKIFNAAKFVCTNFEALATKPTTARSDIENHKIFKKSDIWILSRLYQTIEKSTKEFERFEYAKAREMVEDFFWNDFCDNYLEIAKVRTYGILAQKYENINLSEEQKNIIKNEQQSAILTLYHVLETLLKLFAPFIPHMAEELFQAIFNQDKNYVSIHQRGQWPRLEEHFLDNGLFLQGDVMLKVIFEIRKFKSDNNISLKTSLKSFRINNEVDLKDFYEDLKNVTNSDEIIFTNQNGENLVYEIALN